MKAFDKNYYRHLTAPSHVPTAITTTGITTVIKGGRGYKGSVSLIALRAQVFSILEGYYRDFEKMRKTEDNFLTLDREWDRAHDYAWAYQKIGIITTEEASKYSKALTARLEEVANG